MTETPELHLERILDGPYERLESALRAGPERWVPGYQQEGESITAELAYEQGGSRIRRRIEIRLGPVQRFAYGVTVRIDWKAARHAELYPELEGHLRLETRESAGCRLRLDARYRPPGGRLGTSVDRAVMHRVAESSVQDFLDRVAEALGRG